MVIESSPQIYEAIIKSTLCITILIIHKNECKDISMVIQSAGLIIAVIWYKKTSTEKVTNTNYQCDNNTKDN